MGSTNYQKENNYQLKKTLGTRDSYLKPSYLLFIVFALFIGIQSAFAQPSIEIFHTKIDFGNVAIGYSGTQVITIKNNGTEDLQISDVSITGTGFTGFSYLDAASLSSSLGGGYVLSPHLDLPIEVSHNHTSGSIIAAIRFSPTEAIEYTGTVTLTHNATGGSSTIELTGRGVYEGFPVIEIDPIYTNFGDVFVWNERQLVSPIRIKNIGTAADLEITDLIKIREEGCGFEYGSTNGNIFVVVPPGVTMLNAWAIESIQMGHFGGSGTYTHNAEGSSTTIGFEGNRIERVDFGNVMVGGEPYEKSVKIPSGTSDIIDIIEKPSDGFSVLNDEIKIEPFGNGDILVNFSPTEAREYNGTLKLRTRHEANEFEIPLYGIGICASITADPEMNFGTLKIGEEKDTTIVITNDGSIEVTITSVTINEGTTSFTHGFIGPVTLQPSEITEITVGFKANSVGGASALLTINHNIEGIDPLSVNLVANVLSPVISIEPTALKFKDVPIDLPKVETLTISNEGNADLEITELNLKSEDASLFTFASEYDLPIIIAPSKSFELTVKFLPTSVGEKSAELEIIHNDYTSPTVVSLTGRGVKPEIYIALDTLDFGDVLTGETDIKSFEIKNIGTAPLVISKIVIDGDDVDEFVLNFSPSPLGSIDAGENITIVVKFTPTTNGAKSAVLVIEHNDSDHWPSNLYLQGKGVSPKIAIANDSLDFGDVLYGTSDTKTVTIKNDGDGPLIITSFEISPEEFTLPNNENGLDTITVKAGGSYNLTIQFLPTVSGTLTGTVTLTHNAEGGSRTIKLRGRGRGPSLTVTQNINFGDVTINTTSTQGITIQNGGTANLVISEATINGTGFTLQNVTTPTTITPGARHTITVQFLPTEIGPYEGTVTLKHNAPANDGLSSVRLTGNGIKEPDNIIKVTPNMLEFADIQISSYKDLSIEIENRDINNLRVINFEIRGANKSSFSMLDAVSITILPSDRQTVRVRFKPEEIGRQSAELTMFYTGSIDPFTIPLSGNGLPTVVTLEPQDNTEYDEDGNIDFGEVSAGDEVVPSSLKYITIKNTGGIVANSRGVTSLNKVNSVITITNLEITGPDSALFKRVSDSSDFKPITIEAGSQFVFTFEFLPETPGKKYATTIFTHNFGSTDIGFVAEAFMPIMIVSTTSIGFDNVEISKEKDLPIVIENQGNADLKITNFNIMGTNASLFSVVETTSEIIVEPSNRYTATIRFKPDVIGQKVATLNIVTNIGDITISLSGTGTSTISVNEPEDIMGDGSTFLFQNNPNPIRSGYDATINYRLNKAGTINITVYDVLGREVVKLVDEYKPIGLHSMNFNTKGLPSGVYFYKLRAPGYEGLKKMVVIR